LMRIAAAVPASTSPRTPPTFGLICSMGRRRILNVEPIEDISRGLW
jgi:hypothetical protein